MAATTIRSVLVAAGIPPSSRRAQLSWKQFLAAHAQTLVVADFFSLDTVFFKRLHVLIYVHLATRRVLLATCTAEPNEACLLGALQRRGATSKLRSATTREPS